jgi:hypothetical protein
MTRNGKIARLPHDIREELNQRLRDGESGRALLKWLNEDPECGDVLDEEFAGRPINKQNLSEWRQGGYKDWLRKEEARQRVQVVMEKAEDLEEDAGGMKIADRLGTLLAAELAVAVEQLESIEDPKERWVRLKDIARETYRLRREDHHARKLRMAEEQYEQREKEAERERLLELQDAMQNKPLVAALHSGKKDQWKWTDWEICVKHGLPMPKWWTYPKTAEEWAQLMRPYWWGDGAEAKERNGSGTKAEDRELKMKSGKKGSHAKAKKSKRVRPRQAGSKQKSEPVKAGQTGSNLDKAPGVQAPTVQIPPRRDNDQVPMPGAGRPIDGAAVDDRETTASPSESKSVKPSPIDGDSGGSTT